MLTEQNDQSLLENCTGPSSVKYILNDRIALINKDINECNQKHPSYLLHTHTHNQQQN